eukprot:GHVQ01021466.1.p1 GENE.GHVQ01021466.1~~GHVQ01021466.1.p1  ORF type:complete len:1188 (+),score=133.10 GHVQ01021466.1:777-4340(+)
MIDESPTGLTNRNTSSTRQILSLQYAPYSSFVMYVLRLDRMKYRPDGIFLGIASRLNSITTKEILEPRHISSILAAFSSLIPTSAAVDDPATTAEHEHQLVSQQEGSTTISVSPQAREARDLVLSSLAQQIPRRIDEFTLPHLCACVTALGRAGFESVSVVDSVVGRLEKEYQSYSLEQLATVLHGLSKLKPTRISVFSSVSHRILSLLHNSEQRWLVMILYAYSRVQVNNDLLLSPVVSKLDPAKLDVPSIVAVVYALGRLGFRHEIVDCLLSRLLEIDANWAQSHNHAEQYKGRLGPQHVSNLLFSILRLSLYDRVDVVKYLVGVLEHTPEATWSPQHITNIAYSLDMLCSEGGISIPAGSLQRLESAAIAKLCAFSPQLLGSMAESLAEHLENKTLFASIARHVLTNRGLCFSGKSSVSVVTALLVAQVPYCEAAIVHLLTNLPLTCLDTSTLVQLVACIVHVLRSPRHIHNMLLAEARMRTHTAVSASTAPSHSLVCPQDTSASAKPLGGALDSSFAVIPPVLYNCSLEGLPVSLSPAVSLLPSFIGKLSVEFVDRLPHFPLSAFLAVADLLSHVQLQTVTPPFDLLSASTQRIITDSGLGPCRFSVHSGMRATKHWGMTLNTVERKYSTESTGDVISSSSDGSSKQLTNEPRTSELLAGRSSAEVVMVNFQSWSGEVRSLKAEQRVKASEQAMSVLKRYLEVQNLLKVGEARSLVLRSTTVMMEALASMVDVLNLALQCRLCRLAGERGLNHPALFAAVAHNMLQEAAQTAVEDSKERCSWAFFWACMIEFLKGLSRTEFLGLVEIQWKSELQLVVDHNVSNMPNDTSTSYELLNGLLQCGMLDFVTLSYIVKTQYQTLKVFLARPRMPDGRVASSVEMGPVDPYSREVDIPNHISIAALLVAEESRSLRKKITAEHELDSVVRSQYLNCLTVAMLDFLSSDMPTMPKPEFPATTLQKALELLSNISPAALACFPALVSSLARHLTLTLELLTPVSICSCLRSFGKIHFVQALTSLDTTSGSETAMLQARCGMQGEVDNGCSIVTHVQQWLNDRRCPSVTDSLSTCLRRVLLFESRLSVTDCVSAAYLCTALIDVTSNASRRDVVSNGSGTSMTSDSWQEFLRRLLDKVASQQRQLTQKDTQDLTLIARTMSLEFPEAYRKLSPAVRSLLDNMSSTARRHAY